MKKTRKSHPRHLKALRLQHHRHTGRVLHHKHTSYRGLAVVIGLAGALIIGTATMAKAAADTLLVSARNPAPLPTVPAVITSPGNNTKTTSPQLQVSGTCEVANPPHIVTILDNGQAAGSTPCLADGTFSLIITIALGAHTLIAQTYTITDGVGPDSDPVTVIREAEPGAPITPSSPSGGTPGSPGGQPDTPASLTVTAGRPFVTFGPGKDAVWAGSITGGKPPYQVDINWGDNSTDSHTITNAGQQSFSHRYRNMWAHIITIQVTDAAGQVAIKQYAAVTPYLPPATTTTPKRTWDGSLPAGLYGAYLLVLAVFGALWIWTHPQQYVPAPIPARRRHAARSHSRRIRGMR